MKIKPDVIAVLKDCRVEEDALYMPDYRINNWAAVKKTLEALGGKWNTKAKAVLFTEDDWHEQLLDAMDSQTVFDVTKDLQFYPTPPDIAQLLVQCAYIEPGEHVIEPSAGQGAIAKALQDAGATVQCYEIHQPFCDELNEQGFKTECVDWLTVNVKCDKIVMNPPFTKGQDIKHVMHAYDCLNDGGVLVAIMSSSFLNAAVNPGKKFREWFEPIGEVVEILPHGAFASSGTQVQTAIVRIYKNN